MEHCLLERLHRNLDPLSGSCSPLRALASARALISNPASSDATLHAVLDALLRCLDRRLDPLVFRHALKVLGEIAALRPSFSPPIVTSLQSLLIGGKDLTAEALSVLDSIAAISGEVDGFSLVRSALDENLVLALASSSALSVRLRLIDLLVSSLGRGDDSGLIQPALMARLLLGLSMDLYPSVRRASVDGLVVLCKRTGVELESLMVESCYHRAVELLRDEDELVRSAAIRLVSESGQVFAVSSEGKDNSEQADLVFLQLCSMARDMNMKVRLEAFIALGKVRMVSENVLLQSLSKKVLGVKSGRKSLIAYYVEDSKLPLSCAAGAFVHGIEDEFYEVRGAACNSLGMLARFSVQFADDALNLLMDMLNDDATVVRLQTLQTLFHMATNDCLKVQEKHMHMFLGLLADISAIIRTAARKVLQLMRLPDMEIFKSSIEGLITNLENYPEEEEDIFCALFFIGKNHGIYAANSAKKVLQEILPFHQGELSLDGPRVAAFLLLSISSSFSKEKVVCHLPEEIFLYAIPLFGRITHSLGGFMNRDQLLAYLFRYAKFPLSSSLEFEDQLLFRGAEDVSLGHMICADQICRSSWSILNEISDSKKKILKLGHDSTPLEKYQQKGEVLDEELNYSIKLIFETVAGIHPFTWSQCPVDVRRTLRACKEELEIITYNAGVSIGALLAFASNYIQVIQLFIDILEQVQSERCHNIGMLALDILLEKLETCLKRMGCCFPGLSKEEEGHIFELTLRCHVLRSSKIGVFSQLMLKKMHALVTRLELLCEDGSSHLSELAKELKHFCTERMSTEASELFPVQKYLDLFHLEQLNLSGRFKHIKAEVRVPGNDSENPIPFVPGLPVGITLEIITFNISDNNRVWLHMAVGDSVQYIYLYEFQYAECNEVRKWMVNVSFSATPNSVALILQAGVVMECPVLDVVGSCGGQGGPKGDIMFLSQESDIYLARIENKC